MPMPGVYQLSVDNIVEEAKEVYDLGIPGVILFGIPDDKELKLWGLCMQGPYNFLVVM